MRENQGGQCRKLFYAYDSKNVLDGGQPRSDVCITELAYLLVFISVIKYVCTLDYDSEMRDLKVGNKEQLKAISGSFLPFRTKLRGK